MEMKAELIVTLEGKILQMFGPQTQAHGGFIL